MGLFRRKPRGKHALGAAVTSIPSPGLTLPVAVVPPAVAAPEPFAAEAVDAAEPVAEPDLMESIATLLATGGAWAEVPAPLDPARVSEPARGAPSQGIEPVLPAPPPVQATLPRVQLCFRDGTSTALEPGSSQSLALEQLAQSLTRRG